MLSIRELTLLTPIRRRYARAVHTLPSHAVFKALTHNNIVFLV